MKILHIIAQKPFSTGSGVYLTGLIDALEKLGHEQYLICGIDAEEENSFQSNTLIMTDPVIYKKDVPFYALGMSDVMPYKNTLYKDLTPEMTDQFLGVFRKKIEKALKIFKPDLILCQHLYMTTALTAEILDNTKEEKPYLIGICHGSDLRQFKSNDKMREYIKKGINKLDRIISTHMEQEAEIIKIFGTNKDDILVCGSGFNDKIFNSNDRVKIDTNPIRIVYTGKLTRSKGVMELLDALKLLEDEYDLHLTLIGSSSSEEEMAIIDKKIDLLKLPVVKTGILKQEEIARIYMDSHIFVLPSYYEGMPLTVPESLSSGLRVVVTKLPGFEDWLSLFSDSVSFINLPEMEGIDTPTEIGRLNFIDSTAIALKEQIEKVSLPVNNDLSSMTWIALAERILKI